MPYSISKPLTILIIILLTISQFKDIIIAKYLKTKILLFGLLLPSLSLTVYKDMEEVIRFIPILVIIFFFPFSLFKVNLKQVLIISILILIYIISTQYLLAIDNSLITNFRETYYPSEINVWKYGFIEKGGAVYNREIRFGGIFYNPNVCSSNIFMYLACAVYSLNSVHSKSKQMLILYVTLGFCIYSLFLTGSRTFIIGAGAFIVLKYVNIYQIIEKKKVSYKQLLFLSIIIGMIVFLVITSIDSVIEGLFSQTGSASEKNSIIINYIEFMLNNDIITLVFGGVHKVQFDADLGSIIGAYGLIGLVAVAGVYKNCIKEIPEAIPFIITIILASIGNTIIYNLAASLQVFIVIVVISQTNRFYYSTKGLQFDY